MQAHTNFEFTVDFTDYEPRKQRLPLVEGYYEVKIEEAYINPERNKNRAVFKLAFQGDFEGNTKLTGLNLPGTTKGDVRGLWFDLLQSAGYTLDQLKSGQIKIGTQVLIGKTAYLYYKPKSEDAEMGDTDFYDVFRFREKSVWDIQKAAFEGGSVPKTASAPSIASVPQQSAGFASQNVSSADLLNMVRG